MHAEKYGKPRMFKVSSTVLAMLQALPKNSDFIFEGSLPVFRKTFRKYRARMTAKLKNPRFKRISFHTFRHWKATMEYHKTKDILHIMEMLGHRDIKTTLIYTQLVSFESDEYHSSTAKTTEAAEKLVDELMDKVSRMHIEIGLWILSNCLDVGITNSKMVSVLENFVSHLSSGDLWMESTKSAYLAFTSSILKKTDSYLEIPYATFSIKETPFFGIVAETLLKGALDLEKEKKTIDFDENSLRNRFLAILKTRFDGLATSETFRCKGLTDIVVTNPKNHYEEIVIECKIWRCMHAGATKATEADAKGRMVTFMWELKKQGLKERTIGTYHCYLETMKKRGANLLDPESVKGTIANQKWSENTRALAINAYSKFLEVMHALIAMLNLMPKKDEHIFEGNPRSFGRIFRKYRSRMAHKLQNPRLKKITFHTFRHWKATTEYAKTKDILYVMKMLGHKDIKTTLIYTQLIQFESDEFHSATAKTIEEARQLIEAGFEYVCTYSDLMLYRKRK